MELSAILHDHDFTAVVEYSGNTGNNLSRGELESICTEAIGQSTPDNTVRFIVHTADDKWFLVLYVENADKFLYEKLTALLRTPKSILFFRTAAPEQGK